MSAIALAVLAGVVVGAVVTLTIQDTTADPEAPTARSPSTTRLPDAATSPPDGVVLAWSPGALPESVADATDFGPGVGPTATVRAGTVDLVATTDALGAEVETAPDGMAYPLDVIAVDPPAYTALLPGAAKSPLGSLGDGEVALGATSARLRRIGPGGVLHVRGGERLEVVAVVDDNVIGAAEAVVTVATGASIGITAPRYLLAAYREERVAAEAALREQFPPDTPIRFRAPGETPYLRHGDAVLPPVLIKERFGEFAYRPTAGRSIAQDPEWVAANIVEADVPILGRVRCHRAILPAFAAALDDLATDNLGHLVDPAAFAGCWNARRVEAGSGELSRHAWGVAFDLNWSKNPTGLDSVQDQRLVRILERHGFTWGGDWLVPDPAHFEYLRQPNLRQ